MEHRHKKTSEFLDSNLKTIIQESWSHIKDSVYFTKKIGRIGDIPEYTILVTADLEGLYPNIPQKAGLKALKNALENREQKHIPTETLISMTEFLLKNNFFESNSPVKQ